MNHPPPGTTKDIQGTRTFLLQPHHQFPLQLQTAWSTTTLGIKTRIAEIGHHVSISKGEVEAGVAMNFSPTVWSFLLPAAPSTWSRRLEQFHVGIFGNLF